MNSHDAAERHAAHCAHGRHQAVPQPHRRALELGDHRFDRVPLLRLRSAGAIAARFAPSENGSLVCHSTRPGALPLGLVDRAQQAVEHVVADRVGLALERHDADVVAQVPHPHGVGFEDRGARVGRAFAQHRIGKELPPIDRQRRTRHERVARRRIRALRRVHAARCADLVPARPMPAAGRWPARLPAAMSSATQPATSRQPAACHVSNGPMLPAEAPADREIDVARVVGDRRPGDTRCSGRDRGRSPTGTAPADARSRAASRISRPARGSSATRPLPAPPRPPPAGSRAPPDRAPGCPCRPCGRSPPSSWRPARLAPPGRPGPAAWRTTHATDRPAACRTSS